jgi:DNA-binding NarL/FixJ family response regulator
MNNATQDNYEKAVKIAKWYLKRYGKEILNGKDAHDYAVESIIENTFCRSTVIRNIIDGARAEKGRFHKDKVEVKGKQRQFFDLGNWDKPVYDNIEALYVDEEIQDLVSKIPLSNKQKFVAIRLAKGISKKDIAKELNVCSTRISQIVCEIREKMLKMPEWKNKISNINT